ncbi:sugar-binding domain-containing protein [Neptunitalea lumnitzerae]|uniref:Beta-galactosidase n=1 Tax=Neptunitalea lumnitzerae TaxID=2965509 RepID=A0ABQ5MJL1_9FLAO|nr:sugar-binding domain-containing protein [Neptunitalea sp. Y10]GLB49603.1 beta-galactosidase [Neptunitalea sp. Y10]
MKKIKTLLVLGFIIIITYSCNQHQEKVRITKDFTLDWQFSLGDHPEAVRDSINSDDWRKLNLPHDWSIEGEFSEFNPAKPEGGALPTGIGWYRKEFTLNEAWENKVITIVFDGVYRNSEVWVNGNYLGKRPYGYSSFKYDISRFVKYAGQKNVIAVKVDNSEQPNSRWYTGSGIYRNVWLSVTNKAFVNYWGTFVNTPEITQNRATVSFKATVNNTFESQKKLKIITRILNDKLEEVTKGEEEVVIASGKSKDVKFSLVVDKPKLWNVDHPYLYSVETLVYSNNKLIDNYTTPLGIRSFEFNAQKGFIFNGKSTKIKGVCLHHDLGALGSAINKEAIKRRLVSLKRMGANAIRTAHNPPSPELLQLCDSIGFFVQDELFDVWKKKKVKEDYHNNFEEWHVQDLKDWIVRDRNHPSVFMWSIGNEIREQFDSTGIEITQELTKLVKELDTSRPVTSALTENEPQKNFIYQSGALDVLGFNYKHEAYEDLPNRFKNAKFISSESVSGLATRGHYDFPKDSTQFWPPAHNQPFNGNEDFTVSAYDNIAAYWGATHEDTWKTVKKLPFIAGMFVWTGADYLGEPIPYPYPARSSYFGILDLAGFPKDVYYMYQSEWGNEDVLHLFPHWNWKEGDTIPVWAYYNHADKVELFLNGKSLGVKSKVGDELHVSWDVPYAAGELKAISYKGATKVKETSVKTAGLATSIKLDASKSTIQPNQKDMVFIEVTIQDKNGIMVPDANNHIVFEVTGGADIAGVDNGYQASLEPFQANHRNAYNGKCLLIIKSNGKEEAVHITASSPELSSESITIKSN